MACKARHDLAPHHLTSVISSRNTLPLAHSSPDTLVFLLFLKHARYMHALAVLSGCSTGPLLHLLQLLAYRLAQISPSWRPTLFITTTWPTSALISLPCSIFSFVPIALTFYRTPALLLIVPRDLWQARTSGWLGCSCVLRVTAHLPGSSLLGNLPRRDDSCL